MPTTFFNSFMQKRGLTLPDGRPLYTYRCQADEFANLQRLMGVYPENQFERLRHFDLMILYGAEYWRRKVGDGAWGWEKLIGTTVYSEFAPFNNSYPQFIQQFNQRLTNVWKRRAIKARSGDNEYLATLLVEGGLPANKLNDPNYSLTRFLRTLCSGYAGDFDTLANQCNLPVTFQEPGFYGLCRTLVEELREIVSTLPVGTSHDQALKILSQEQPQWTEKLPIVLEGTQTEDVLALLLDSALTGARRSGSIRWQPSLTQLSDGRWSTILNLQYPAEVVREHLHCLRLGERSTLFAGITPMLNLLPLTNTEEEAWRPERLSTSLRHDLTTSLDVMWIGPTGGEESLPELSFVGMASEPWYFSTRPDAQSAYRLLGISSLRTTESNVYALLPPGFSVSETVPFHGQMDNGWKLYLFTGQIIVHGPDGLSRRLITHSHELPVQYRLDGPWVKIPGLETTAYMGMPMLKEKVAEQFQPVSPTHLRWRPHGRAAWQSGMPGSGIWGNIDIGILSQEGILAHQLKFTVVPPHANLHIERLPQGGGSYYLRGWPVQVVSATNGITILPVKKQGQEWIITCPPSTNDTQAISTINLQVEPNIHLQLNPPYPLPEANVIDQHGHFVRPTDNMILGDLANFTLPLKSGKTADVHAKLIDSAHNFNITSRIIRHQGLGSLIPMLAQLRTKDSSTNAKIRLSINAGFQPQVYLLNSKPPPLNVNDTMQIASINRSRGGNIEPSLYLWPLENFSQPALCLPSNSVGVVNLKNLPANSSGWLAIAMAGDDIALSEPTILTNKPATAQSPAYLASLLAPPAKRPNLIKSLWLDMLTHPQTGKWAWFSKITALPEMVDFAAWELTTALAKLPSVLLAALLRAEDDITRWRLHNMAVKSGLSWFTVPIADWFKAKKHVQEWIEGLNLSPDMKNLIIHKQWQILAQIMPSHGEICKWLASQQLDVPLNWKQSSQPMVLNMTLKIHWNAAFQTQDQLFWPMPKRGMYDELEHWLNKEQWLLPAPYGEQSESHRHVQLAPLLAAQFAVLNQAPPADVALALAEAEFFAPTWFTAAYSIYLPALLTKRHNEGKLFPKC